MGLFSRRRAAVAVAEDAWRYERESYELLEGDDADMDDDGQSGDVFGYRAYQVSFGNAVVPGARITIWTYVAYAGDDGYETGARYQYSRDDTPGWAYTGYIPDPGSTGPLADAGAADQMAQEWATAMTRPDGYWVQALPEPFEWDGEPFEWARR